MGQAIAMEPLMDQTRGTQISPDPSFSKRGIPPFVKGGQEGFGFRACTIMDSLKKTGFLFSRNDGKRHFRTFYEATPQGRKKASPGRALRM
jgi:hypothetical protein